VNDGEQAVENIGAGTLSLPSAFGSGSAEATGTLGLTLSGLQVETHGSVGDGGLMTSSAGIVFYFVVVPIPGFTPPPNTNVPIHAAISLHGSVSVGGNNFTDFAEAGVLADAIMSTATGDFPATIEADCSFSNHIEHCEGGPIVDGGLDIVSLAVPFTQNAVDVDVSGSGGANGATFAQWSTNTDPMIEIDPSFPLRDDFMLIFSPGIVAAIPEPSTWALLLGGLIAAVVPLRQHHRPQARTKPGEIGATARPTWSQACWLGWPAP
jgi:hypothetical protein